MSLEVGEEPLLRAKATEKLKAMSENMELCPGLHLCFQGEVRVVGKHTETVLRVVVLFFATVEGIPNSSA